MEEGKKVENREVRTPRRGTARPSSQPLNMLALLAGINEVTRVEVGGDFLYRGHVVIMAIIHEENIKNKYLCTYKKVYSRFGSKSQIGNYVSFLERSCLINRNQGQGYNLTIEGELLLRQISTELFRLLLNRPTRRKVKKGSQPKRQRPAIETFEQLVNEVLNKAGLNQRVKYALLRALGMSAKQAKAAAQQLQPLTHTERIKPVLKCLLSQIPSDTNTKS